MVKQIAVLALQGDYQKHALMLARLGLAPVLLRYPDQLDLVEGLVIPGGESTVLSRLITSAGLAEPLIAFSRRAPVLGTCTGLIMMGRLSQPSSVKTLKILDIEVERNAYGRQLDSFMADISVDVEQQSQQVTACFIRAPKIKQAGRQVTVLARHNGDSVAVRQGQHLGLTFHPEMNDLTLFHRLAFLQ